jgi:hypothetical protein
MRVAESIVFILRLTVYYTSMDDLTKEEEKIGKALVRMGALTQEQVEDILQRQKAGNSSLFGVIAIELGYIDPETLLRYLASKER